MCSVYIPVINCAHDRPSYVRIEAIGIRMTSVALFSVLFLCGADTLIESGKYLQ